MGTLKKIGSIAVDVLVVIIFAISLVLVIANITADKENGEQPNVFGYVISSVQTESMSGTFEQGSLVVGKLVDENTEIRKDDIISFYQKEGSATIINTHRVVAVDQTGSITLYQTQGDNREMCPTPDREWKSIDDVVSVYQFDIPAVGGFIDFLKEPLGFVLCLVLPMLAFIGWQIYKLISIYLEAKKEEMLEKAKEGVSDEAKDAIIREYLAKMQQQQGNANAPEAQSDTPEADAASESQQQTESEKD